MTRILIVCVILMAITRILFAQERIQGVVTDSITHNSIAGAAVSVEDANHERLHIRATASDGRYDFPLTIGARYIRIRALGYHDTSFEIGHVLFRSIVLVNIPWHSDEVVVTAQHHVTALEDVPISVATVSSKELASRASFVIDDALRWIPGVSVTESQVNIRGSSGYGRGVGSRVLFMLDGMPLLAADNGDIKFDVVPMLDIDHIEVVKGSGSALYGSSALGGIINIISRPTSDSLSFGAVIVGGMYDQPKYDSWRVPSVGSHFASGEFAASGNVGGVGLLGTVALRRDEGYRIGDDSKKENIFLKATAPITTSITSTTSFLMANDDHGGWLYWKSLSTPLFPSDSVSAVNGRIHSAKANLQTSFDFLSTSISQTIRADVYLTKFTTDPDTIGEAEGPHSAGINSTLEYDLNADLGTIFLTNGAILNSQNVTSDLFTDHHALSLAAFSQAEYHIENATITAGLRADAIRYDSQPYITQLSPKIGVSYGVDEHLSFRASAGTGFRAPTISEQFIDQVFSIFPVRPNPSLTPEHSVSTEIGGSFRNPYLFFDAALFYTRFQQLIEPTFVTGPTSSFIQFRNITDAEIFGHEEVLEWHPLGNNDLSARIGYTYVFPRNRETNEILEFRPRHLLQTRLEGQIGYFDASADFRYISRYESVDSVLLRQVPNGDARVAVYVLDARIGVDTKPWTGIPAKLTFQVENLLNYYYVEIVGNLAPLRSFSLRLETAF